MCSCNLCAVLAKNCPFGSLTAHYLTLKKLQIMEVSNAPYLNLILLLCSPYLTPSTLLRFVCCSRRVLQRMNSDPDLVHIWEINYAATGSKFCQFMLREKNSLLDILSLFYSQENKLVDQLTQLQREPLAGCSVKLFRKFLLYIAGCFDMYGLCNVAHTDLTVFLVAIASILILREHTCTDRTRASTKGVLKYLLHNYDTGRSSRIELRYSEWGQHNLYGFRTRDVQRTTTFDAGFVLNDAIKYIEDGADFQSEMPSLLILLSLMERAEDTMISCLNEPRLVAVDLQRIV